MNKLKPLRLPKMSEDEIEALINEQRICRISFKRYDYPYLAPFQYVYKDGSLYFHFTDYGKKMKLVEKDNRVCVGIESLETNLSDYRFVVFSGVLEVVDDPEERSEVITLMAESGKEKLSENFLAAHGLRREEGWDALTPGLPIVIIKLKDITSITGLKSPY